MILIGDTHGLNAVIKNEIRNQNITDTHFIHVGDFGVGYPKHGIEWLEDMNDFMKSRNCILFVIRGNHDDPSYFYGEHTYSNLKLVPDYTVLELEDRRILCVGGAISIDRKTRTTLVDWFPFEEFKFDKDKIDEIKGVDMVVTHTAPDFVYPYGINDVVKHYALGDPTLIHVLAKERAQITEMYDRLQMNNYIQHWFYGHFHETVDVDLKGTSFHLLSIMEFRSLD